MGNKLEEHFGSYGEIAGREVQHSANSTLHQLKTSRALNCNQQSDRSRSRVIRNSCEPSPGVKTRVAEAKIELCDKKIRPRQRPSEGKFLNYLLQVLMIQTSVSIAAAEDSDYGVVLDYVFANQSDVAVHILNQMLSVGQYIQDVSHCSMDDSWHLRYGSFPLKTRFHLGSCLDRGEASIALVSDSRLIYSEVNRSIQLRYERIVGREELTAVTLYGTKVFLSERVKKVNACKGEGYYLFMLGERTGSLALGSDCYEPGPGIALRSPPEIETKAPPPVPCQKDTSQTTHEHKYPDLVDVAEATIVAYKKLKDKWE